MVDGLSQTISLVGELYSSEMFNTGYSTSYHILSFFCVTLCTPYILLSTPYSVYVAVTEPVPPVSSLCDCSIQCSFSPRSLVPPANH